MAVLQLNGGTTTMMIMLLMLMLLAIITVMGMNSIAFVVGTVARTRLLFALDDNETTESAEREAWQLGSKQTEGPELELGLEGSRDYKA